MTVRHTGAPDHTDEFGGAAGSATAGHRPGEAGLQAAGNPAPIGRFIAGVAGAFFASRLVVLAILVAIYGPGADLIRLVSIWDGAHYLAVAAHGYGSSVGHSSLVVFFPLYPLLVRALAATTAMGLQPAAAVVSALSGLFACLGVALLVRAQAGGRAGLRAGWLLAMAPGAMFLSPAYADGLAIAFCALSLLGLRRHRWTRAELAAGVATATSTLAVPIVIAAAWAAWQARDRKALVSPALSVAGVAAYFAYLWAHTGSPVAWFVAERRGWGGHHVSALAPFHWLATFSGASLVEASCTVLASAGLWAMARARVPVSWWIYAVVLLASIVFDAGLWLTPRFVMDAFPLAAAAAMAVEGRQFRVLAVGSGLLMVLTLVAYMSLTGFVYKP